MTKQNQAMNHILSNYLTKQYSNNILVYVMFYLVCEECGLKMYRIYEAKTFSLFKVKLEWKYLGRCI